MNLVRRILSVLLILGLALGTTAQAAQMGMMAGMQAGMQAGAMDDGSMAGCEGCASSQENGKGMGMASCHKGVCIALPGLLPTSPGSPSVASGTFASTVATIAKGLSPPPDHRPPIPASLA